MDIDRLAFKHLTRHPNDKSLGSYAKLSRPLGIREADRIIVSMAETLEMSGLEIRKRRFGHPDGNLLKPRYWYAFPA